MSRLDIIFEDAAAVVNKVDFSWLEGKTVLITGATGLLGTHFLATLALLQDWGMNIKVFGVCHSDPESYTTEIAKGRQIYLVDDWMGEGLSMDAVLHLSGYAQPSKFTINQVETIRINTALTNELLDTLRAGGKFLFASSSEVYSGARPGMTVTEGDMGITSPVFHPRAAYIEGKRCGEAIVNAYRQTGVDAKSARLCLTYGPGTRPNDDRAMSQFIRMALEDGAVNMKYSGRDTRTFCYVSDAVEMMWNTLLHGTQPVYNIGAPYLYTMEEVAFRIADLTNVPFSYPGEAAELKGSDGIRMNMDLAVVEFNKNNWVGLTDGLRRTIDWNRGFRGTL